MKKINFNADFPVSEKAKLATLKDHVEDGPQTLKSKWLDPECWNGCQSLVYKKMAEKAEAELSALREDKARLKKLNEDFAAMLKSAMSDPYWKSQIGNAEKLLQRQAIDQARKA